MLSCLEAQPQGHFRRKDSFLLSSPQPPLLDKYYQSSSIRAVVLSSRQPQSHSGHDRACHVPQRRAAKAHKDGESAAEGPAKSRAAREGKERGTRRGAPVVDKPRKVCQLVPYFHFQFQNGSSAPFACILGLNTTSRPRSRNHYQLNVLNSAF